MVRKELRKRLDRQLAQPLALGQQPFLERWLGHGESGKEVALVQRRRLLERLRCPVGDTTLESNQIDLHDRRIESDAVLFDDQKWQCGEGLANHEERLTQTGARFDLAQTSPE